MAIVMEQLKERSYLTQTPPATPDPKVPRAGHFTHDEKDIAMKEAHQQPTIDLLGLSNRPRNCLERAGISELADLVRMTQPELLNLRGMGQTSLREITARLEAHGLALPVQEPTQPPLVTEPTRVEEAALTDNVYRDLALRLEQGETFSELAHHQDLPRTLNQSDRNRLICDLYIERRLSMRRTAECFGISSEAVRQILRRETGHSGKDVRAKAREKMETDHQELAARLREDIRNNPGDTVEQVAARVDCEPAVVEQLTSSKDRKFLIRPDEDPSDSNAESRLLWPSDQMLAALKEAELYEFPLTGTTYDRLVRIGEIKGPTRAVFFYRFGSWTTACAMAGVECREAIRDNYQSEWSDSDLYEFVWRYLNEPQTSGTFAGFESWARTTTGAPSGGTLRNRLGTWEQIRNAALRYHVEVSATRQPNGEDINT